MRLRRCRPTCSNPGTCSDSMPSASTPLKMRRRNERARRTPDAQKQYRSRERSWSPNSFRMQRVREGLLMISNGCRAAILFSLVAASMFCAVAVRAETIALKGGSLYASPEAAMIPDAVVVVSDGVISAVGKSADVQIPAGARVIDCSGKTIVAGFWNSHVHFTEPVWKNAATAP